MRVTHSDWRSSSDSSRTSVRTASCSNRRRISVVPSVERWSVATTCVDAEREVVEQVRLHDIRLIADEQREDDLHPGRTRRIARRTMRSSRHGSPGLERCHAGARGRRASAGCGSTSASPSTAASTANDGGLERRRPLEAERVAPVRTVASASRTRVSSLEEAFGQRPRSTSSGPNASAAKYASTWPLAAASCWSAWYAVPAARATSAEA